MTTRYSVINMLDKPTYPCEYPAQHDLYPYDLCSKDYFNSKVYLNMDSNILTIYCGSTNP